MPFIHNKGNGTETTYLQPWHQQARANWSSKPKGVSQVEAFEKPYLQRESPIWLSTILVEKNVPISAATRLSHLLFLVILQLE